MSYGYNSSKFLLPSPVEGDTLSGSEEQRKVDIVDSNLEGALYLLTDGSGCGVILEGTYLGTFVSGASTVTLSENKPTPAIEGLINEIYVKTSNQLSWLALLNNTTYYLYLTLVESSTQSSRQYRDVVTSFNTSGITPVNSILVATAVTTGATITVDSSPGGKKYVIPFQTHVADSTDPHGVTLTQTNLNVTSLLATSEVVDNLVVNNHFGASGISVFHSGVVIEEDLKVYKGIDVTNQKITSLLTPDVGTDAANKSYVDSMGGAASGIDIKDNGIIIVSKATKVNFSGVGVVVTSSGGGEALIDIAGNDGAGIAGIDIEKNSSLITSEATILRFSGIGVNVTDLGGGRAKIDIAGNETLAHKTTHQDGGNDEISVTGLSGLLTDAQKIVVKNDTGTVGTRVNLHFSGVGIVVTDIPGSNEVLVDVAGNAPGLITHKTTHENGGNDEIDVTSLSGLLNDVQKINVKNDAGIVGSRVNLHFTGIGVTATDVPANNEVIIDIPRYGIPGVDVKKNNTLIVNDATILKFSGIGVSVNDLGGGQALVDIPGSTGGGGGIAGIDVEKNSVLITSDATILRFSGIGVNVTDLGSSRALVDIAGNEPGLVAHKTTHQDGGNDEISVTGLSGLLNDIQKITVKNDAGTVGTHPNIKFSGIGVVVTDNPGSNEVIIDVAGNAGTGIAGIDIEKNSTLITNDATILRFSGIGVSVTDLGGSRALVDIPGTTSGSTVDQGSIIKINWTFGGY